MKKFLFFLLSINILCYGCSSDKTIKNEISDRIDVTIEQGRSSVSINDDTAEIRRSKFSISFKFTQPDGVLINASFNPETFNNAKRASP